VDFLLALIELFG